MQMKFKYFNIPKAWPHMVALLEGYRPKFQFKMVKWYPPPSDWWKCNTDGASTCNSLPSAAAFSVRNHEGDRFGAKGVKIPNTQQI
ncbi:hypothetical protein KY290_024465 [Solanum tuberosum]|uniref:RNase H family protein n=1 Tax=Solanum tuberosum TaxID=4113 RepID=A0ABQ7UTX7_SOLTU|nr:hypothetical protein KY290_024465 [Solanum tuberosum]